MMRWNVRRRKCVCEERSSCLALRLQLAGGNLAEEDLLGPVGHACEVRVLLAVLDEVIDLGAEAGGGGIATAVVAVVVSYNGDVPPIFCPDAL